MVLLLLAAACSGPPFDGAERSTELGERLDRLPPSVDVSPDVVPAPTTTLRWAITEPSGVTPDTAFDQAGQVILDLLYDSLTAVGRDDEAAPSLASSWRSQNNARRWVFTLRQDARFHDGAPVTADDVIRGWEAGVAAGRPQLHDVVGYAGVRSGSEGHLGGLTAPDPHTLVVQLRTPDIDFPLVAAHPALAPLPEGSGDPAYAEQPVGNGPFRMAEPWARGRFVRLSRVAAAPEGEGVREVVFRVGDPPTAYVQFQQDRADVAPIPGSALSSAIAQYGQAPAGTTEPGVRTDPMPDLVYLGINTAVAPWDDVEVRRAVSLAIDRQALADALGEGNVDPARALVPPAVPGHLPRTCTTCSQRVDEAREIFAQRGIASLTLTYEETAGDDVLVERLTEDLAEAGVRLVPRPLPFAEVLDALEDGRFGLYRFGWMTETPSAYGAIAPLVGAPEPQAGVNVNYGRYDDPEVQQLLSASRTSRDDGRRRRLLKQAERLALGRDQAVVPLYTTRSRVLVSQRVRGLQLDPFRTDLSTVAVADER